MESIGDIVRIESELGSGGSSAVYKAWHHRLQKNVVLKEMKYDAVKDMAARRNEVEALKNIKSMHVPHVLDFLTEDDRSFTVMEFVEGESLDKLIARDRKFTEAEVIRWYGQLALALKDIHMQNVCHRDIKPSNIMLTPGGDVCLIDFNSALVEGNGVQLVSRSLGYASPEQYAAFQRHGNAQTAIAHNVKQDACTTGKAEGAAHPAGTSPTCDETDITELVEGDIISEDNQPNISSIDWKRSDIYSLGATMLHLLTGIRPPRQPQGFVPGRHIGRLNKNLIDIIKRSMQVNPAGRFPSAAALLNAIKSISKKDNRKKKTNTRKAAAIVVITAAVVMICICKSSRRSPKPAL